MYKSDSDESDKSDKEEEDIGSTLMFSSLLKQDIKQEMKNSDFRPKAIEKQEVDLNDELWKFMNEIN